MIEDCERYSALSDQTALGEPLDEEQRHFMNEHGGRCPACRAEASIWSRLGETLENPSRLTDAFPVADRAPVPPTQVGGRLRRQLRRLAWGSAVAAVAAVSVVWFGLRTSSTRVGGGVESSEAATAAHSKPTAEVRLVLVAGTTNINQQPARSGRRLALGDDVDVARGRACLLLPPGVTVCADEGTRLKVERLAANNRRLQLRNGRAVARLERQPTGSSFGFETSAGSIVAKGTVFSLTAFDEQVALRVHEGTVVQRRAENVAEFAAPAAVLLSRSGPAKRPTEQLWTDDKRLLDVAKRFSDGATCELQVTSMAAGVVSLDDTELGSTPLSALLAPGSYLLGLQQGGRAPVAERLTLWDGARLVRNYEAQANAEGSQPSVAVRPAAPSPSAPEQPSRNPAGLLAEARTLRQGGRFAEAGATYARLLREYPTSSEARAATVSLGELYLSQLGDAKSALRSFDAYLSRPGALSQEAGYGRIRALQKLGRAEDAQRAIEAYLATYPKSPQAATLRKERR
jgi:tetratricopeptide (TPR) repeat protein